MKIVHNKLNLVYWNNNFWGKGAKKLEKAPRSGKFLKITASFEENPAESGSPPLKNLAPPLLAQPPPQVKISASPPPFAIFEKMASPPQTRGGDTMAGGGYPPSVVNCTPSYFVHHL